MIYGADYLLASSLQVLIRPRAVIAAEAYVVIPHLSQDMLIANNCQVNSVSTSFQVVSV